MSENHCLKDKVILVTGAGRGIGQAMATVFAQNGAVVYANDVRPGTVEAWNESVNREGPGEVRPLYFDISSEQEAKAAEADPVQSEAELRERIETRRKHLLRVRESLIERMDVKK